MATPPDSPLDGSILGWLYNPVFATDPAGVLRRGWADFAGGGVAVYEDWCQAEQVFDFWLLAQPDGVALLRAIGLSPQPDAQSPLRSAKSSMPALLAVAQDMWTLAAAIRQRHEALGRWPESFQELGELLSSTGGKTVRSHDNADFHRYLKHLAVLHARHVAA